MENIEIKTDKFKIVPIQSELCLFTSKLDEEIAYSIFSPLLQKVGMARNLNTELLTNFFAEINPDKIQKYGLIEIRIVGGNDSTNSKDYFQELIKQLILIDGG